MTFSAIRNDVGSRINQYDSATDTFVSGFITTGEVNRWINQSFEDIYKWYALANKGRFSTSVTMDLSEEEETYLLNTDAENLLAIESVMVLLADGDTDYVRAYPIEYNDFVLQGSEEVPSSAPRFFEKQVYDEVSGNYVLAIEFIADSIPVEDITDGMIVRYLERPSTMTDDGDIPEKLPQELHKIIVIGATIPALEKMSEYDAAMYLEGKYNSLIKTFFVQEQSRTAQGVKRVKPRRSDALRFYLRTK